MTSRIEKPTDDGATTDEAIGRPGPWREGRYQESGQPLDESVIRKPKEGPPDTISTTVTRRDYESLEKPAGNPPQR